MISEKQQQLLGVGMIVLMMVGMFLPPAFMSISMIGLSLLFFIRSDKKNIINRIKSHPAFLLIIIYFIIYLISGLYSENIDWYLNRMQLKLPFLFLPIAMMSLPLMNKRYYYPLLYLFFIMILGMSLYLTLYYAFNFEMVNDGYQRGKVLPTPIMHIRYSIMVVYAFFIGIYLYLKKWKFRWNIDRYILLSGSIFLFAFVHILAVRTGIVSLYATILVLLIAWVFRSGNYIKGLLVLFIISLSAALAIWKIPTLQNKYRYTKYSLEEFVNGNDIGRLSDSYRIVSIKAGMAIGNNSPIIGVGAGDVKDLTAQYVQEHYPDIAHTTYTPQNQYVITYAILGLIGVLVFLAMTLTPLFIKGSWADINFIAFHTILITSFIVEQTLESQIGITFYLLFGLMGIRYLIDNKPSIISDDKL